MYRPAKRGFGINFVECISERRWSPVLDRVETRKPPATEFRLCSRLFFNFLNRRNLVQTVQFLTKSSFGRLCIFDFVEGSSDGSAVEYRSPNSLRPTVRRLWQIRYSIKSKPEVAPTYRLIQAPYRRFLLRSMVLTEPNS